MLRTRDDVSVTVGSRGSGRDGLDKGASRVRIVMFCIVAISHERKRDALRSGMWESIAEELLIAGDKDLTERMYPERNDTADQHRIRAQQYWKSRETTNWACNLRARIQNNIHASQRCDNNAWKSRETINLVGGLRARTQRNIRSSQRSDIDTCTVLVKSGRAWLLASSCVTVCDLYRQRIPSPLKERLSSDLVKVQIVSKSHAEQV